MNFSDYQDKAYETAVYPRGVVYTEGGVVVDVGLLYAILGLEGEAGEVADKFKKALRDEKGIIRTADRLAMLDELGDVLWYLTAVAEELGSSLETVAERNIEKLASRKTRGTIHGEGDNR